MESFHIVAVCGNKVECCFDNVACCFDGRGLRLEDNNTGERDGSKMMARSYIWPFWYSVGL